MFGMVLILSPLAVGTGVASFLLLRAGYGPLAWGLPPLALLLVALALGVIAWRVASRSLPGRRDEPRQ